MKNKFLTTIIVVLVTLFSAILLVSCNDTKPTNNENEKKNVVTTAWFSYDIAKQIGKDKINLQMAFPHTTNLHSLELNAEVFVKIKDADLLITTSKFIDHKLVGDTADKSHLPHQDKILDLFNSLFPNYNPNEGHHHHHHVHDHSNDNHNHEHSHEGHNHNHENEMNENKEEKEHSENHDNHNHEHSNEGHNHNHENNHEHEHNEEHDHEREHEIEHIKAHAYFHYWTSIENLINSAKAINNKLVQIDEKNKDFYNQNLQEFVTSYTTVKNEFKEYLKGKTALPIMYVGHDSIGAFMLEFGLVNQYIPIDIHIDDHNETTAMMKKAFIDEVKEHNLKVIFVPEMNEKEKEAKTILEELNNGKEEADKVKAYEFHGFHNISDEVFKNSSLLDLIKQNIQNLKQLIK